MAPVSAPASSVRDEFNQDCLSGLLPSYYSRVFPADLMYKWLSYGSPDFFARREFSFTLAGDIYLRYQSFNSEEEFVAELKKRKPEKIDIGGVYNQKPKTRDSLQEFIPLQKEFVLDIDLTDYDDVRTCCSGAKVCVKCWKFIALAVKILDRSMRDEFGFKNILWVFSGRRGVHCWICDNTALKMDGQARTAILDYLTIIKGGENQAKKVTIKRPERLHPFVSQSLRIIDDVFYDICHEDQNMLAEGDKNFEMLPVEVKEACAKKPDRFAAVMNYLEENKSKKRSFLALIPELKLQLCYPRLDYNVSKDLNHLLKSPFCVHPKTGQICVPFDPKDVDGFNPTEVPTIVTLVGEVKEIDGSAPGETQGKKAQLDLQEYKKTSLGPYIEVFKKFVDKLKTQRDVDGIKEAKKQGGASMDF